MSFDDLTKRAFELALRTKDYPEGAPCMFVSYRGYIEALDVELYKTGWSRDIEPDFRMYCYVDNNNQAWDSMEEKLDSIEKEIDAYEQKRGTNESRIC